MFLIKGHELSIGWSKCAFRLHWWGKRLLPKWDLDEMIKCAQDGTLLTCIRGVQIWILARTRTDTRVFAVFLSTARQTTGKYLKVGHDCLLSLPLHFLIRCHLILQHCMAWFTDSVVKQTTNKVLEETKTLATQCAKIRRIWDTSLVLPVKRGTMG